MQSYLYVVFLKHKWDYSIFILWVAFFTCLGDLSMSNAYPSTLFSKISFYFIHFIVCRVFLSIWALISFSFSYICSSVAESMDFIARLSDFCYKYYCCQYYYYVIFLFFTNMGNTVINILVPKLLYLLVNSPVGKFLELEVLG